MIEDLIKAMKKTQIASLLGAVIFLLFGILSIWRAWFDYKTLHLGGMAGAMQSLGVISQPLWAQWIMTPAAIWTMIILFGAIGIASVVTAFKLINVFYHASK